MAYNGRASSRRGVVLALINACFIAGYTLVDGTGVRLSGSALGYTLWSFLMNGSCLLGWATIARRHEVSRYLRQHWHKGLLGGISTMGSYGLALWAMTQAPLAVVAALRETSILFGPHRLCAAKERVIPLALCRLRHRGRRDPAAPLLADMATLVADYCLQNLPLIPDNRRRVVVLSFLCGRFLHRLRDVPVTYSYLPLLTKYSST
nr:integral membrane protein [Raoultella sp. NCTC 9187]